jgi:hypothetical protein
MIISRRILKKAPLPYKITKCNKRSHHKLINIILKSYNKMFGERINLSTKEFKDWGEFLCQRQIYWDVYVSNKKDWAGWTHIEGDPLGFEFGCRMVPTNIANHIKVCYYYIPKDLAMKMLVLGELL